VYFYNCFYFSLNVMLFMTSRKCRYANLLLLLLYYAFEHSHFLNFLLKKFQCEMCLCVDDHSEPNAKSCSYLSQKYSVYVFYKDDDERKREVCTGTKLGIFSLCIYIGSSFAFYTMCNNIWCVSLSFFSQRASLSFFIYKSAYSPIKLLVLMTLILKCLYGFSLLSNITPVCMCVLVKSEESFSMCPTTPCFECIISRRNLLLKGLRDYTIL